tara:strand:- start:1064 stop:1246 length:183 start_codon:yes stop_codon:yes gene_type:complete
VEGFNIPNTSEKYIDSNVAAAIDAVFRNHACGVEDVSVPLHKYVGIIWKENRFLFLMDSV